MGMAIRTSGRVIALALIALAAAGVTARSPEAACYPECDRQCEVAKFKLIGATHPHYERQGASRHHYASDRAVGSWGKFYEGSVIVAERVHAAFGEVGMWEAGAQEPVAVMRIDRKHHADTGGWYFSLFIGPNATFGLTPAEDKSACFDACYKAQGARDSVFSDPRR
jgi:hypothetical protein